MDQRTDRARGAVEGPPASTTSGTQLRLRLYVAAAAPNSLQAMGNLRALLSAAGIEDASVEIVDCVREPQRALRDGVLVTPTLLKLEPAPVRTIIGALTDGAAVTLALGLPMPAAGGVEA